MNFFLANESFMYDSWSMKNEMVKELIAATTEVMNDSSLSVYEKDASVARIVEAFEAACS